MQLEASETPSSRSVLSYRDARLYLISRFLWMGATQILNVAVGWLVYDLTASAWALGLVGLAAFAPRLILTLYSGWVADRYDRRLVVGAGLATMGAASSGLLALVALSLTSVGAIYVLFIVFGVARGMATPAAQAMVPTLVPRALLSRAVGLSSSTGQMASIIGPAIGGVLYVFGAWVPFAVATFAFFSAAGLNLSMASTIKRATGAPPKWTDALAGLSFIRKHPVILGALSLDMFCVLLGGATALLPIVADEILHVGPIGLGILRATPGVGAMMLGIFLSVFPIERKAGTKLFAATAVFGVATIGLGLSTNLVLSLALLWLIGASDVFTVVIRHTLVQGDTPNEMRGRVAAVNALFIGASNELGEFESGATAAIFGLVPAILLGGAGTLAVAAVWAIRFPQLRQRDALVELQSKSST